MHDFQAWLFGIVMFGILGGGGAALVLRLCRRWDRKARARADAIHAAHMRALVGGSWRGDENG